MDDFSETLQAAQRGDEAAFVRLFEFALPMVAAVLRADLPSDIRAVEDDLDLLQVTYMEAWLAIGSLEDRGPRAFLGWMITLARRNMLNAIHWERRIKRGGHRRPLPLIDEADKPNQMQPHTPSAVAGFVETRGLLDLALASLQTSQRHLLHMYHGRGLSPKQIAEVIGKTPGAVNMALRRLELHVRRRLDGRAPH